MFEKKQIPNWISTFRIIASVPLLYPFARSGLWGWFILIGAGIAGTDWVDGFVAKRFEWHSKPGKLLDPIGDKVCAYTLKFFIIGEHGLFDALFWPLVIILVYDSGTLLMRWFTIESANEVARWKTSMLFISLFAMAYPLHDGEYRQLLMYWGEIAFQFTSVLAIISGAIYIHRNVRIPAFS